MTVRIGRPHICGGARKSRCIPKHGRNKAKCDRYLKDERREKNKARRARRIAKGFRLTN